MSIPNTEFIKIFLNGKVKRKKNILYSFIGNTMYVYNIELAIKYNNLLLLNEDVEIQGIDKIREIIMKIAPVYNYKIIRIPMRIGEEKFSDIAGIREKLRNRLMYYYENQAELYNNQTRADYMAYFEEFKQFLYKTTKAKINRPLQTLYNNLSDKEYVKNLKLKVARHKALQK